jgi:hypothetical protein
MCREGWETLFSSEISAILNYKLVPATPNSPSLFSRDNTQWLCPASPQYVRLGPQWVMSHGIGAVQIQCPLRSESDQSAALPQIDAMCQKGRIRLHRVMVRRNPFRTQTHDNNAFFNTDLRPAQE